MREINAALAAAQDLERLQRQENEARCTAAALAEAELKLHESNRILTETQNQRLTELVQAHDETKKQFLKAESQKMELLLQQAAKQAAQEGAASKRNALELEWEKTKSLHLLETHELNELETLWQKLRETNISPDDAPSETEEVPAVISVKEEKTKASKASKGAGKEKNKGSKLDESEVDATQAGADQIEDAAASRQKKLREICDSKFLHVYQMTDAYRTKPAGVRSIAIVEEREDFF